MKVLALVALSGALMCCAQEYMLGPDSQTHDNVPHGTVTKYVLAPGKVYPGTPHNYQVYVPAQYNASKAAPFMIYLDGSGAAGNSQRVPVVFDNLIAKGDLPPLIGIFVDPGVLPALSEQQQSRYARTYEYDSIGPKFSQFLETELIAEVAKKYNLSKNPDDHAIAGVSTGAVGAFIAAWNRPDLFHRVLSFIGTFVDMKGADSLPAMIRKTEPKPIRIFMQDGANDHLAPGQPYGTFYGGSWPINNQVMYEAFEFAGYDAKLTIGTGAHDMKQGAAIMPEALRWLWRDYPKPIVAGHPPAMGEKGWDARGQVYGVIEPGKGWEAIAGDYQSALSPTGDKDGNVYFADPAANRIYKATPDGKAVVFKEKSGGASAVRFGADGRLYASQPGQKRIVSYGPGGDEKVVATGVVANDLALTQGNDLYFLSAAAKALGLVRAGSSKAAMYPLGGMTSPAVLTLTPDQAFVEVGDSVSKFSWSFQISKDGAPVNGEPLYRVDLPEMTLASEVAGATVDSIGQVYFATALGVQFCEQNGRCAGILAKPELHGSVSGIAFGGPNLDWLYAVEGDRLYRRQVKSKGVTAWSPVKPPRPPL
ncbi:MAG: SMP-30/gluconolactonase/LRE family protein [Acidobacteriota bacterium]|nr:SMP-30/gluconolactonase/LRE family protein [Acidobacteriota bacterium]